MRYAILTACLFIFGFISVTSIHGQVKINEFYSAGKEDWIEIYNPLEDEFLLEGHLLRDSTDSNKKPLSGSIPPKGFLIFEWDNLNKDKDLIRLVLDDQLIDSIDYGNSDLIAPNSEQSAGRMTDGSEEWIIFSEPSKGETNSIAKVYFTPTPTPTRTPSPTKVPTIKKTTPTKTPKISTVITVDAENENRKLASTHSSVLSAESLDQSDTSSKESVLGNNYTSQDDNNIESVKTAILGDSDNKFGGTLLIIGGVILFSTCGILLMKKRKATE